MKMDAVNLLLNNTDKTFTTAVFNGSASLRDASGQLIENVVKSVRRKETIDESYMDKLFSDVTSLYRLDQKRQTGMEKADLGPLPKAAVILLSVLGITWIGIILYVTRKFWTKLLVFRHNNH